MYLSCLLPVLAAIGHASAQGLNFTLINSILEAKPAALTQPPAIASHQDPSSVYNSKATISSIEGKAHSATITTVYKITSTGKKTTVTVKPTSAKRATSSSKSKTTTTRAKAHIRDVSTSSTTTTLSTSSVVDINGPCSPQPNAIGMVSRPDTGKGFLNWGQFTTYSTAATVPYGYNVSFSVQTSAVSGNTYLGFYPLASYSPQTCADYCDATTGCLAFNIYFERTPKLNPASACPNPASITQVRCTLWGSNVTSSMLTNSGQWRSTFQIVIAGSNGYNKYVAPSAVASYTGPSALQGAINVATINSNPVFTAAGFYAQTYDAAVCAALCKTTNTNNRFAARQAGNATYLPCNYFNAFVLSTYNVPKGMYCQLYTTADVAAYAGLTSQSYNGGVYDVTYSWGYVAQTVDNGTLLTA